MWPRKPCADEEAKNVSSCHFYQHHFQSTSGLLRVGSSEVEFPDAAAALLENPLLHCSQRNEQQARVQTRRRTEAIMRLARISTRPAGEKCARSLCWQCTDALKLRGNGPNNKRCNRFMVSCFRLFFFTQPINFPSNKKRLLCTSR